jgi:hypothetical protein
LPGLKFNKEGVTMRRLEGALRGVACAMALTVFLAGCGGSDSGQASNGGGAGNTPPPTTNNPPPPETVQGVATPSNVSVVTATNAD